MSEREAPLVALVCSVPLLSEALCDALVGLAECKVISAAEPDLPGLLRSLRPDAIVVDDEYEAEAAASYLRFARTPVVQVSLRTHRLRVLEDGHWQDLEHVEATSETVRNLVAGELYGRRAPR